MVGYDWINNCIIRLPETEGFSRPKKPENLDPPWVESLSEPKNFTVAVLSEDNINVDDISPLYHH